MKTSSTGIGLIQRFESCSTVAYLDAHGRYAIGWGHNGGVEKDDTCTYSEANAWFAQDLAGAEAAVTELAVVPLNQNQFDALVDFTYNLGVNAFKYSTLLKWLNQGHYDLAAKEFLKWNHAKGAVRPGLTERRMSEMNLFLSSTPPLNETTV